MTTKSAPVPSTAGQSAVVASAPNPTPAASVQSSPQGGHVAKTGIVLPKDCDYVSVDGSSVAVVLCRPAETGLTQKLLNDAPSLILSLSAIVVSLYALKVTGNQQKKSIAQSIKDDYWLRTLVSPTCITPLIEMRQNLLKDIPDTSVTKPELQHLSVRFSLKFSDMQDALGNLHIVDASLVETTRQRLTEVEDVVSEYIGQLGQHVNDPANFNAPDMNVYRTHISGKFFDVLRPIQEHQINQGGI